MYELGINALWQGLYQTHNPPNSRLGRFSKYTADLMHLVFSRCHMQGTERQCMLFLMSTLVVKMAHPTHLLVYQFFLCNWLGFQRTYFEAVAMFFLIHFPRMTLHYPTFFQFSVCVRARACVLSAMQACTDT